MSYANIKKQCQEVGKKKKPKSSSEGSAAGF